MPFVYQIPSRLLFYKDRGKKTLTIAPSLTASDPDAGKYMSSRFTVVGSPTITSDGVASGFSSSDYLEVQGEAVLKSNFEITVAFRFTSLSGTHCILNVARGNTSDSYYGVMITKGTDNKITVSLSSNGTSWDYSDIIFDTTLATSTLYTLDLQCANGTLAAHLAHGGTTETKTVSNINIFSGSKYTYIGCRCDGQNALSAGSISLKQFLLSVNGTQIARGSVPTPDPDETVVTLTSAGKTITGKTGSYIKGSIVDYSVSHPYFPSVSDSTRVDENKRIIVPMTEYSWCTLTINPSQTDSTITFTCLDGYQTGTNTFKVHTGSSITYLVEKVGYVSMSDTVTITEDKTIDVTQSLAWLIYTGDSYTGEQSTDANYDLGTTP